MKTLHEFIVPTGGACNCIELSALSLLVGQQEGHTACRTN